MSASQSPAHGTPRARRALIATAALIVGLALAEIGHRVWLATQGRAHDSAAAAADFQRLASLAGDLTPRAGNDPDLPFNPPGTDAQARFLHPFLGWEQRSSVLQWEEQAERLAAPRDPRDYEVVVVGGSVSEIFAGMGSGALMYALLEDARFQGRRLRVRGWGRGGWKAPQTLFAVQWLLQRGVPIDAVILLDGFNEVALSADNAGIGILPAYPSAMHWAAMASGGTLDRDSVDLLVDARSGQRAVESATRRALDLGFAHSSLLTALARGSAERALARSRAAFAEFGRRAVDSAREEVLRGAPFDPDLAVVIPDAVRAWQECSRQMAAVCRTHDIAFLHVLQPTLHDAGAKPRTAEEIEKGVMGPAWQAAVERGYPLLRAAGEELAREGVPFVDATRVFADVETTLYFDACHFGPEGNRILGRWIGARFLERLPR